MGTTAVVSVICILAANLIQTSLACNGYQIKVNHIRTCNPSSLIKMERFNVTLDNKCNVIPTGCVVISKPFETAQAHYVINKPPLPTIEGDIDICDALATNTDAGLNEALSTFHLPNKCPVKAGKSCNNGNQKLNIGKYKNRLSVIAGTLSITTDITHDTGTSCVDINLTIEKPQRG